MKILLAVDDSLYSRYAAQEAARLAFNAWADVTILGLCGPDSWAGQTGGCPPGQGPTTQVMAGYQEMFFGHGPREENPYIPNRQSLEWVEMGPGVWEELTVIRGARKNLKLRLRQGGSSQVLAEDAADDYDILVLGCGPNGQSLAGAGEGALQKLLEGARASTLLIKQDQAIAKIICCLDDSEVPQRSLEMINLLATIHGASLELLGVTREGWLKVDVDSKLSGLSRYFGTNQDKVRTGFKEHSQLAPFVAQEARPDLLVLWRGRQSVLSSLFPRKWLGEMVAKSQSSMLVLR